MRGAVQFDLDRRALDGHLHEVPLADRPQVAAVGGDHAVGRAVELPRVELRVLRGGVVEDLQLAHRLTSRRVAFAGVADRQAVVAAGRQLVLEAGDEVGVLVLGVDVPALLRLAARWRRPSTS